MISEAHTANVAASAALPAVRVRIRNGCDLHAGAVPGPVIHRSAVVRQVALCGADFIGLKPEMRVKEGDAVRCGQVLFVDKRDPAVKYTAPGSGTIKAVRRGERRVLEQVVIRLDDDDTATIPWGGEWLRGGANPSRDDITTGLAESGLWTAFRTRPFSHVPRLADEPAAIFVTAIDTQPLAADPNAVIRPRYGEFEHGLRILTRLTRGTVWLCTSPDWDKGEPAIDGVRRAEFSGPHPAGLVGTHMHQLDPVSATRQAWHIGYQDVIAIGALFAAGLLDCSRVVALGGGPVSQPRLLRTRQGASLQELVAGEVEEGKAYRLVSGSWLSGRLAGSGPDFLGRYHQQLTLLPEVPTPRALGWWWRSWNWQRRHAETASPQGTASGMLPLEVFERLVAPGFLATPLLRALMAGDIELARALGCLELDPEDLALCAWACPSRCDYGGALRHTLDRLAQGG